MSNQQTQVLIISSDPLAAKLAGPGIRAMEMARYIAQSCAVTLAAPNRADVSIPGVTCVAFQPADQAHMLELVALADVVVAQGYTFYHYPVIAASKKITVVDLYDPFHLENLEMHTKNRHPQRRELAISDIGVLADQLQLGDFFICASERQRDLWLGALSMTERLSPFSYEQDPTFRTLIDVVPFGLPPSPPIATAPVLKGVVPGIDADDTVVLWGGGIWEWLDPLTIIRAMAAIRERQPAIKLFFLGQHHPNTEVVPVMAMYDQAVALAEELGLRNTTVFFNDRWVPYAERQNYLLEADIGVSAHSEHIETRFAFRTRLLDYIWAGLPMIVAEGDALADVVAVRGLGHVVPIGDHAAFAAALLALADDGGDTREPYVAAFAAARAGFTWPTAIAPLARFCANPRRAPDRQLAALSAPAASTPDQPAADTDQAVPAPPAAAPSHLRRIHELDAIIAGKNAHIARLENLIKRLEQGRVMRLLRWLRR